MLPLSLAPRVTLLFLISALGTHCSWGPSGNDGSAFMSEEDGPSVLFASGWSEIIIQANYATTKVDVTAHFHTSRNGCGKEEYGVLELDLWNRLAKGINYFMHIQSLNDEYCLPLPEGNKTLDGTAEVSIKKVKRMLFEAKGNQICTKIPDQQVAHDLLTSLIQVVITADREGCTNGWAS